MPLLGLPHVIIGGGVAGVVCCRELLRLLPPSSPAPVLVTVEPSLSLSTPAERKERKERGGFQENLLAAHDPDDPLVAAAKDVTVDIVTAKEFRRLFPKIRLVVGRVTEVDAQAKAVSVETAQGQTRIRYQDLLLATGASP
ncbi:hypothetical protein TeGR_g7422, partial [Tetraparma gracilis]